METVKNFQLEKPVKRKRELIKTDLQKVSKLVNSRSRVSDYKEVFKSEEPIYIPNEIALLSQKLKWDEKYLRKVLFQKGIHKTENEILTSEEISEIRPMVKSRYKALMRELKRDMLHQSANWRKSIGRGIACGESVYDKLAMYGPGKLIYIRSR